MTHAEVYIQAAQTSTQLAGMAFAAEQRDTTLDLLAFGFQCLKKAVELADDCPPPTF